MAQDPSSLPGGGFGEEADNRTDGPSGADRGQTPPDSAWPGRDEFVLDDEKAKAEQQAWLASATMSSPTASAATAVRSEDDAAEPQTKHNSEPANPWDQSDDKRVWVWAAGFLGGVLFLGILGGLWLKVPYVALVPGSAKDTEPLLEVAGADEFPSDGELLFTTVRVRQRPNLWEYLWLRADDDANVVPEEQILGDRTPEENRQFNLSMMNDSKQIAIAVALNQLGYDAVQTDAVVVQQLVPDTPAEASLVLGDSIMAIDGQPTTNTGELVEILGGRLPGDGVLLSVQRFGEEELREIEVTLAANPERPEAGFLGIQPVDRPRYLNDFGFTVDIDSGSVGGPSAGLAFTLAVLDQLTPGELTGGAQVAVTGTINAVGDVGPVGGVLQKTAAVSEMGVDAFIVPAGLAEAELEAIEARAGDDLQIIPVFTLEEALDALAGLGGDVAAVQEYAAANAS